MDDHEKTLENPEHAIDDVVDRPASYTDLPEADQHEGIEADRSIIYPVSHFSYDCGHFLFEKL